jgi:hypothetical protein
MSSFSRKSARQIALTLTDNVGSELGLVEAFVEVCHFLHDNPASLSWRSRKNRPNIYTSEGLAMLANKHFSGYRRSDFPKPPNTVPDEAVSIVMRVAYDYSVEQCERIKLEHQHSMCAENCVGALLERYLDSVMRPEGWHWCCGNFVKAVDFISREQSGQWLALQIEITLKTRQVAQFGKERPSKSGFDLFPKNLVQIGTTYHHLCKDTHSQNRVS